MAPLLLPHHHLLTLSQSSLRGLRSIAGRGKKGVSAWHGPAPTPPSFALTAIMCLLPTAFDLSVWEPESIWRQQRADVFPPPGQQWKSKTASLLVPWQRKKETILVGLHCTQFCRSKTLVRWAGVLQTCSWRSSPSQPCSATEGRDMDPKAAVPLARMLAARAPQQGWALGCCACPCAASGAWPASCTH